MRKEKERGGENKEVMGDGTAYDKGSCQNPLQLSRCRLLPRVRPEDPQRTGEAMCSPIAHEPTDLKVFVDPFSLPPEYLKNLPDLK